MEAKEKRKKYFMGRDSMLEIKTDTLPALFLHFFFSRPAFINYIGYRVKGV